MAYPSHSASCAIEENINIDVLDISGTTLQSVHVPSTMLGRDLVNFIKQQCPQRRGLIAKVLHKETLIDGHTPLARQGIIDDSQLTLVWQRISARQGRAVVQKMRSHPGTYWSELLGEEEKAILSIIVKFCWANEDLDNMVLLGGLQELTFDKTFNQSLDRTALPSGLQSLTFGADFNQNLDGTALPTGLESLTFGYSFNRSLDRTTLPSGLQSLMFVLGFNEKLDKTVLPSGLQSLTFRGGFSRQSHGNMTLPCDIRISHL